MFALSCSMAYSQLEGTTSNLDIINVKNYEGLAQGDSNVLKYEDISGTPYVDITFKEAKISEKYPNVSVRYNSYKDEIEFKNGEKILVLPKEEEFYRIEIIYPKQVLVYQSIEGNIDGYYYEIISGENSLFKKIRTKFTDFKKASSPYASDTPPFFSSLSPEFYIKANGKILKDPKKEKQIMELFPDKKDVLNSFFKKNKINLNKEEDLIKLVKFLNA